MIEETTNNKLPSINENAELEEQVIIFFKVIYIILYIFFYIDKLCSARIFQLLY